MQSNLIKGLYTSRLAVYSFKDKIKYISITLFYFSNKPKLKLVGVFTKDLNKYIIEQEAKSKNNLKKV